MLKKRIPTILGILLLLAGITAGVYLVELGPQPLTTRATPEVVPQTTPPSQDTQPPATQTPAASQTTEEATESGFTFDTFSGPITEESAVTVDSPGEGEALNTQLPEFLGEGPPGTTLEIILESEHQVEGNATVSGSGQWSWAPEEPLEPGEHFLTIRWLDESGLVRSLTRRFVVYAQGESSLPAFEATPSATGTPTPTPTPVEIAAITPTPTPVPTATPTPVPTVKPSTPSAVASEPAVPVPGMGLMSLAIILTGVGLFVSGAYLHLRRR